MGTTNNQRARYDRLTGGERFGIGAGATSEVEAKTAGWVAGVVQLDRAANVRLGMSATLH